MNDNNLRLALGSLRSCSGLSLTNIGLAVGVEQEINAPLYHPITVRRTPM